jgi:hypothetical protein
MIFHKMQIFQSGGRGVVEDHDWVMLTFAGGAS